MAYVINKYDGTVVATVEDGTVNQTLDIKLIGKNYAGYGEIQNENSLFMLENFAREVPPPNAVRGQLWYDTLNKKMKFYTGDQLAGNKVWKTAGGVDAGVVEPNNSTEGDLWFDTGVMQLKVRTSNGWLVIGPQAAGEGVTQMVSRMVKATDGRLYPIIAATVEDEVVYIISKDSTVFTIDRNDANNADIKDSYTTIGKGLNLPNATTSTTEAQYRGTATNSLKLEGLGANAFIQVSNPVFVNTASFSNTGFTVGDNDNLKVYTSGVNPVLETITGSNILFRVQNNTVTTTPLVITADGVEPGITDTYNLGSPSKKWRTIYATNIDGISSKADTLLLDGGYRYAISATASASTIVGRTPDGNIVGNLFQGIATAARYADLAEKYLADEMYPIGTVVVIGGEKEITASKFGKRALGVVSENPAFMMNSSQVDGTYIALKGRVPVFVNGPVKKGDELIADDNGVATAIYDAEYASKVFAIALEDNDYSGITLIECAIL